MLQKVNRWLVTGSLVLMAIGGLSSCKGKKKAMEVSDKAPAEIVEKDVSYDDANRELEENARKAMEAKALSTSEKLTGYFAAISSASTGTSANNSISEALTLFASPTVPVLIVIYADNNGEVDYDEPTTAEKYLNYLKDQKRNLNNIRDMKTNASGKITELELIKR